jgi:hypothetical protein
MIDYSVPFLRSGIGRSPKDGGCIMQVIDWIDRCEWTDVPTCVHPILRAAAINVNDALGDGERQKLLALAPRLMGTTSGDNKISLRLAVWCAEYVLPIFTSRFPDDRRPQEAVAATKQYCEVADIKVNVNAAYAAAYAAADVGSDYAAGPAYAAAQAAYAAAQAAYAAYAAYTACTEIQAAEAAACAVCDAAACAARAIANDLTGGGYLFLVELLDEYDRITSRVAAPDAIDWRPVCEVMSR